MSGNWRTLIHNWRENALVIDISRKWRKPSLSVPSFIYIKKIVTGSLINITVDSLVTFARAIFFLPEIDIHTSRKINLSRFTGLALWYELGATWSLREVSQPSKVSPVTYRAVFPINVLGEPFFYPRRYIISCASTGGQYNQSLFTGEIVRRYTRNPPEVKIFLTR